MRISRRLLLASLLTAGIALASVNAASSAVRADLTQPTQGLNISENWNFKASVPSLVAVPEDRETQGMYFCSSIDDPKCVATKNISITSHLPACDLTIKSNCISSVYAIDPSGKKFEGIFQLRIPDSSTLDFSAMPTNNIPQGRGQGGIWKIPGVTHGGGNENFYVTALLSGGISKKADSKVTTEQATMDRIDAGIVPVNEKRGKYSPQFGSDASSKSTDGSVNGGFGSGNLSQEPDKESCVIYGQGFCEIPQAFPVDYRFGMSIKLGLALRSSWFHGRIYRPDMTVTSDSQSGQIITIDALPVIVPSVYERIATSALSPELTAYLSSTKQFAMGGGYLMPGSTGNDAFDLTKLWLPLIKDKATTSQGYWEFRTLDGSGSSDLDRCTNQSNGLLGVVTTNALVYSAGPPSFNKESETLDYKLLSPHYTSESQTATGTYDLLIRSDIARCIYGFSKAPIQASIQVVSANGENQVATTRINESDGWIKLSAGGFTFSSPTVKVKMTQEKVAPAVVPEPMATQMATPSMKKPVVKSITCTKGKSKIVVKGAAPKCPVGFKKAS